MWLDAFDDCAIDANGIKKVGLQLILCHDGDDAQYYYNVTGGRCYNWRRAKGTRVPLCMNGVAYLEDYFKNNKKSSMKIGEPLESYNKRWLLSKRMCVEDKNGVSYYIFPQLDKVDLKIIQSGLRDGTFAELPTGVPGIEIDYSSPFENEEAWINVMVDKAFNRFSAYKHDHLLPCYGVLTWDNSV